MKDTEQFLEAAGETAEYAKQYVKLQLDYLRLESAEKIAKTASSLIASLVVATLGLITLLMLSLAAGFFLGQLWGSYGLAFLAVAGFYALLALLVLVFKERWLTNPILTQIIRSFFD
ncbi:MAG: phage holin family protein [Saprospiraceae bacterium]|nr:phage holin family protein [Saprospiraceae bacterium]